MGWRKMGKDLTTLPEGFVIDNDLPEGFVLDEPDMSNVDTFDDETKAKMDNSLFYSSISDKDPNDVFDYTDEINEQVHGNPSNVAAQKKNVNQLGYFGKIKESASRGHQQYAADIAIYTAIESGDKAEIDKAIALKKKMIQNEQLNPIEGNWLSKITFAGANTAGQIVDSMKAGGKGGIVAGSIGAGVGAIVSLAVPTVGEEAPAVGAGAVAGLKVGARFGFASGSAIAEFRQGVGEMYFNMIEDGTNPEVAEIVAKIGGIPYAIIGQAQMSQLLPGQKKQVLKQLEKKILPIVLDFGKRYVKTYGGEVGEEVLQKLTTDMSETVAKVMSGQDIKFDKKFFKEELNSLLSEGKGAAEGMLLVSIPGAAIDTSVATKAQSDTKIQIQQEAMKEQVAEQGGEEIPDITEEEFVRVLGLPEASTINEENQGGQTPTEVVSQGEGQVAQEIKPESKAVESKEEIKPDKYYDYTLEEKANELLDKPSENDQLELYHKHINDTFDTIKSEISKRQDIEELTFTQGSGSSFYGTIYNKEGETVSFRISNHAGVYGGYDIGLNANDSIKTNLELIIDKVNEEWGVQSPSGPSPVKETPVSASKTQEVSNVDTLQERDILGGEDPIQVLRQNLKKAKELVPQIEAEQEVTKKERFQKMKDVAQELINKQGLTPSQALNIARIQLSGEQTTYQGRYESIRDRLEQSSPGTVKALELTVWQSSELQLMDKDNLIRALNKLIDGHYLQEGEIKKIRSFFGNTLGDIAETRRINVPWYEQIVDIYRAGLLTGIKTWGPLGINMLSNFTHAITETTSDIVAAGVDNLVALKTGERTIAATLRGEITGFKKGIGEFFKYMKTGIDSRVIDKKYDWSERSYGNGKWAKLRQGYVNSIFHILGAEDILCYYAAEGRSYYNQALADGMNNGLSGKELDAYADKLAVNPTEKMIEIGMRDAEQAVFMNKTDLGDIAAKLQGVSVIGKIVVPFSRTPSAVAMQIVNYTPVGTAKEIIQQIHRGKFDQRKFSQAFGRSVVGTAALVIGGELLKTGLMTLGYPKGERERKLWEVEGRKPFSIKVGNKYRSIYILGPVGNVLLVGGYFQQAYQETGSPTEAMTVALAGGAKSIAEATFLRGLNQALSAVSEPETSWNRWFSDMAGSMVPTIAADFARAIDTTERRAEGPVAKIANRLPGLRQLLQPKLDIFGQDLPRYGGNPLEVMIDPTRPVKINQDIVVDELRRLWDVNVKVSPTLLGDRMGYDVLTDEENTLLWRRAGHYTYSGLFSMMMSSDYKTETDEEKGKMIEELVKNAKDLARAEIVMSKMSEGYTETELRKDGLLTNDVKKLLGD
jgi:hypothetical protein